MAATHGLSGQASGVGARGSAQDLLLGSAGDTIPAQKALALMLVNYVVPPEEVLPKAEELARKITANAPFSISAIKEAAIKGSEMGLEERVAFA